MHENLCQNLSQIAKHALYSELITYPKPGLVSLVDNGSHIDMNYETFLNSINVIGSYFELIAKAAINKESFKSLNKLGRDAEIKMLNATNGINTHRGAIFIMGLLVAATAYSIEANSYSIQNNLVKLWGDELLLHKVNQNSHGNYVRNLFNLSSIVTNAATGFQNIFSKVKKYNELCFKYGRDFARVVTFLLILEQLEDTNLVYRGGIDGLIFAQKSAGDILRKHKDNMIELYKQTIILHHKFKERNLSPGGSADILAAVIFLSEVYTEYGISG